MDFGKVSARWQLDQIQFKLPAEDKRSPLTAAVAKTAIYIGCPVWGKPEWVGKIYPKKTPPRDFLKYYSRQFNTIELNSTFYGIPEPATLARWKEVVPPEFRFCPKVFQGISRFETLTAIPDLTRHFCDSMLLLGPNLGISFMQLPPAFGPARLRVLERFFTLLPKNFPLAIEFRNPDWFSSGRIIDPAFQLLAENNIATVITDVAGRRDVLHTSLTRRTAVIRFVGNTLHPSDWTRLDSWITRLGAWITQGIESIYFFVHQPEEEGILEIVSELIRRLNSEHSLKLTHWDPGLAHPQPDLFN